MISTESRVLKNTYADFALQRPGLDKLLRFGATELGVLLSEEQRSGLLDYVGLLVKWNTVYNLTAIRTPRKIVIQHLLDSLAIVPHIAPRSPASLLDVGSGGGLPGIVIALAMPLCNVMNNDTVHNKTAFQQQVKGCLCLQNLSIITGRVQTLRAKINVPDQFSAIVSRAFSGLADFVRLSRHLVAPGGTLWAMKGVFPSKEIACLPVGVTVRQVIPLEVPLLDAKRHLVEIAVELE
ncbi:16S rRNA (guanine(527)-N(7))-methyltransferase RsmG [Candidatus Vallotia cooleyia]|uniref:16S rRNA (guanine(527)-N(7))-methyltransferase RsmG n=1 Tax=Candidatus Vallotiella adelgis TaxID=1177211 RepID=UPI001D008CC7|nr:16S rRNA (guanine(527)-N(7))-methyltransferase RsmG [Candidatus Vallotia cooleyia]UDG81815.1 Ribosomal RNA small subunit methyltransferase G [Candidatus Vallotia cooleyia]